jgi:hypothetical protein
MAVINKARWIEKIPVVGGVAKTARVAGNVFKVGAIAAAAYGVYRLGRRLIFKNAERKVERKELSNRKIEANIRAQQLKEEMSRAA